MFYICFTYVLHMEIINIKAITILAVKEVDGKKYDFVKRLDRISAANTMLDEFKDDWHC